MHKILRITLRSLRLPQNLASSNGQNERAIACASVVRYPSLERVATEIIDTTVQEPYEPGFLAFREIEPYSQLVHRLRNAGVRPDVFMVDGFGVLHPRGCGSASHLGVREASTRTVTRATKDSFENQSLALLLHLQCSFQVADD